MIDISGKTNAKILEDMLLRVSEELNKREGSLIRTSLAAASWAIEGLYIDLQYVQRQAFGQTATTDYLTLIAEEAGIDRKPAIAAIRKGRFNIAPPLGAQFSVVSAGDNLYYSLTKEAEYSPDSEYPNADYVGELTCETLGTIGNVYSGKLSTIGFINGLTDALLLDVLIPGVDIETDASLRARYLAAIGRVEFAGNIDAYKSFMLAQPGVGAVQIWPVWNGPGTVLISAVDDNYKPLTNSKLFDLQILVCPPELGDATPSAMGYGMAPIGAVVSVTTPSAISMNVTADIKIKSSSARSISDIQEDAEIAIENYLLEQCRYWGEMSAWNKATYSLVIYYNKIVSVLNNIDGVEVASNVLLNGNTSDSVLVQTAHIYGTKVPELGTVTLTEVT